MESAVARGQGVSATGAPLEILSLEAIMPSSVAMVVNIETDNKNRTMADLRMLIKNNGGIVTPTAYLFQKRGRVVFEKDERGLGIDDVLDDAIEAGADDVEDDEDGNIVIWTEPSLTTATAEALVKRLDLKTQSSEIVWDANEDTKVKLNTEDEVQALGKLVEALQDSTNVQGVFVNAARGDVDDETWGFLEDRVAV